MPLAVTIPGGQRTPRPIPELGGEFRFLLLRFVFELEMTVMPD